jgi:hypothetical protein
MRQMEQWIGANQGNILSASAMDVTGFTARHKRLRSNNPERLTGMRELGLGQLSQLVAGRHQRELAASGTDIGPKMYPCGAAL